MKTEEPVVYVLWLTRARGGHRMSQRQWQSRATQGRLRCFFVFGEVADEESPETVLNDAWLHVHNLRLASENDKDHKFTHVAVLHDDVVPNDWWLDTLYEDMTETGADVLAAAVPCKGMEGLLNVAVDDPSDAYAPTRRLTVNESHRLPEVFTAADCGYPSRKLLVGSDCVLIDIRGDWVTATENGARAVLFASRRDLVYNEHQGRWVQRRFAADWNFCRAAQECGASVVATRRLPLLHMAHEHPYPNHAPWGEWDYDEDLRHKFNGQPIEHVRSTRLSDEEKDLLCETVFDKRVLEIGPDCGLDANNLDRTAYAVARPDRGKGGERVVVGGEDAARLGVVAGFDVVLINGYTNLDGARADVRTALRNLAPCGLLLFRNPLLRVLHDLRQDGAEVVGRKGSLTILRPTETQRLDAAGVTRVRAATPEVKPDPATMGYKS